MLGTIQNTPRSCDLDHSLYVLPKAGPESDYSSFLIHASGVVGTYYISGPINYSIAPPSLGTLTLLIFMNASLHHQ